MAIPNASDEQVYAAAKYAHADEFINQLPDGYHSFLGEQGVQAFWWAKTTYCAGARYF